MFTRRRINNKDSKIILNIITIANVIQIISLDKVLKKGTYKFDIQTDAKNEGYIRLELYSGNFSDASWNNEIHWQTSTTHDLSSFNFRFSNKPKPDKQLNIVITKL